MKIALKKNAKLRFKCVTEKENFASKMFKTMENA